MNEEQKKEFQELCCACEHDNVWKAILIHTVRELNDTLKSVIKLADDKASFANRELSSIDCRLQTIENNIAPIVKLLDSCDSRLGSIESYAGGYS